MPVSMDSDDHQSNPDTFIDQGIGAGARAELRPRRQRRPRANGAWNARAGCRGLHLDDASQDAIPRRAVLLGAHRGGFLIADDHLLLGIPVNGPPAEAKRHIAEVAYDGRSMAHFQIAERLVARLHRSEEHTSELQSLR